MLILILILATAQSKIFEGSMTVPFLRQQHFWFYLGRQTLSPGQSKISLQTTMQGAPFSQFENLQFAIIEEQQWDSQPYKCRFTPSRLHSHPIKFNGDVTTTTFSLNQTQSKLYYFIFRDCQQKLLGQKDNYRMSINYKLTIMTNQSFMGHNQGYSLILFQFIITIIMCYKVKKDGQKTEEKDLIQVGYLLGLFSQIIALFFKILSYVSEYKSGSSSNILQILYLISSALSESIIMSVLLCISFGWTIIFIKIQEYQKYIPPISAFSFLNIILSVLGILNNSVHDKYHLFDSIPGVLRMIVKIIITFIFLYGVYKSYYKGNQSQQLFILMFGAVGVLYLISMPFTYILCQSFISPGKQEYYGLIISQVFHMIFNIIFTYNLVVSSSFYRENRKRHTFLPVDSKFY